MIGWELQAEACWPFRLNHSLTLFTTNNTWTQKLWYIKHSSLTKHSVRFQIQTNIGYTTANGGNDFLYRPTKIRDTRFNEYDSEVTSGTAICENNVSPRQQSHSSTIVTEKVEYSTSAVPKHNVPSSNSEV